MWKHIFFILALVMLLSGVSAAAADEADATDSRQHTACLSGSGGPLPIFSPAGELTRADAAGMLRVLLNESEEAVILHDKISDQCNAWFTQAIQGGPEGEADFQPEEPLTRAEFIRCLTCFFPLRTDGELFVDVAETHADAPFIRSAEACGWVQGDENGCFRPDDRITRVEAVVMFNRVTGRVPDRTYIDQTRPFFYRDVTPANWYYYEVMEAAVPHEFHSVDGAEQWDSHLPQPSEPETGFYLIDEQFYYYDGEKQDILRNETYEILRFSASGQCFAESPRMNTKMRKMLAEEPDLTLIDLEERLAESAAAEWSLILINGSNPLPEGFAVPELSTLDNGYQIDSRVYPALQSMLEGARAAGYHPMVCSAYRTDDKQTTLHRQKVNYYLSRGYSRDRAAEAAAFWVARPGTSEHQAGLAADIVDSGYPVLNRSQENRPVQKWLMEHCAEYGFILRYPTTKSDLTGVGYEPWHYRYVGIEAAEEIMSRGICLEEYLGES